MIKDQCISITELRVNTKNCLKDLQKEPKYIFVNNKPVAVLIDIEEYEDKFYTTRLTELKSNEVDKNLIKEATKAKKINKNKLLNI